MLRMMRILLFAIFMAIILVACNMPGGSTTPTPGPEAIFTVAAQTVQAQLTQTSVNPTETPVPLIPPATGEPTATPESVVVIPSATAVPVITATPLCDAAGFVSDITVPDGTQFSPNAPFRKTWRIKNIGTCTWNTSYSIVFEGGNAMNAAASYPLPGNVPPGSVIDISVDFTAPGTTGDYTSNWKLRNASGVKFGLGAAGANPFWTKIKVAALPAGIAYDFSASYCSAQWVGGTISSSETLPCPGTETDNRGFVIQVKEPKFENESTDNEPALYTYPKWVDNGIIAGKYPSFTVQTGDRFQSVVGCLYREGGSSCNVRFQLNYIEAGSTTPQALGEWVQTYDGNIQPIDISLDALSGKTVQFVLVVMANGSSTQDMAFWLYPRIKR